MAEASFEVRYEGEAVRAGRMEVRELAPSLLALSRLFAQASVLLYPENEPVALEIQGTREGSFVVDLVLHAAGSGWDQLSQMGLAEDLTALTVFQQFVIGHSVDLSLLGFVRWLRGRPVVAEEEGPGPDQVTVREEEGREVVIRAEVARMAADARVRKDLREAVEPLRREGVDSLEVRSGSGSGLRLEKDDAPAFEAPESDGPDVVSEQEIDVFLDVLTAELETGSTRKWRFGGLGQSFTASIEDPSFMEKVERHEVVFGAGDKLRARVRIIQREELGTGRIKAERRIVEVYERVKAPEQLRIRDSVGEFEATDEDEPRRLLGSGE